MSSSSLTSGISASPSAAASTARHRHDGAPQQLRVKAAVRPQQQQLLHGGRRHTRGSAVVVRAGPGPLSEIEPDLEEDAIDVYRTNGIAPEDFVFGKYDGHHTYFETQDKKGFWEDVSEWYQEAEPPQGFQALISWAFPPAIILGMAFNVPGEYLYIGAAVFIVVFCIFEMRKPDKPHNFEPEIYMMERSARDKLIADYNSMDIWDFNEKYGELWDFTVNPRDDIVKST
ncbi:photosynthetic NDH subunit of subcomplex B 5, chloroplastic-like [Miscanthus floridulus]|uniref:photosynthetic NDH subunit of subcomplex B 5, chloroplastic-like n=1 Tax=Miscanthus floridulus TaxID=154761 RepID=UPI00345AF4C0